MRKLTTYGIYGAVGAALATVSSSLITGKSLFEAAEPTIIPIGIFLAFAAYAAIDRRGILWSITVAVPVLLAAAALKVLLWPLEGGSPLIHVLLLGGTAGAVWGCCLPLLLRRQERMQTDVQSGRIG